MSAHTRAGHVSSSPRYCVITDSMEQLTYITIEDHALHGPVSHKYHDSIDGSKTRHEYHSLQPPYKHISRIDKTSSPLRKLRVLCSASNLDLDAYQRRALQYIQHRNQRRSQSRFEDVSDPPDVQNSTTPGTEQTDREDETASTSSHFPASERSNYREENCEKSIRTTRSLMLITFTRRTAKDRRQRSEDGANFRTHRVSTCRYR